MSMADETAGSAPGAAPKERKERKEYNGTGFGPAAPSKNLQFPVHANMTAVELLTFFPNSVRCADVIYRLISNGGSPHAIWAIVNTQRDLSSEWGQNSCRQWMYDAMDKAGYKEWRFKAHKKFHEQRKTPWDEANLDVAGFTTPGQIGRKATLPTDIPFKNLAVDVRHIPQGNDALDLTRMVEYCVQNPHDPWRYPRDYATLLGLVGGAAPIGPEHIDRKAFKRWAGVVPPPPSLDREQLLLRDQENEGTKRKRTWSIERKMSATGRQSRTGTPESSARSTTNTPIPDSQQLQKPRGRPKKTARVADEAPEAARDEDMESQEYIRTAIYVAPPADAIRPWVEIELPYEEAINFAFLREGDVGEIDSRSAYAFGGPRLTPPYRWLCQIDQPDPADSSGWAENLRWAAEQHACFRYTYRPDAWNESAEHMQRIVQIRKDQVWMSDEYLGQRFNQAEE
jgi:hypothetical protein